MELFKQFTQMLEDFIISIVDKRMAERQPQPAVAVGLEEQVLKLLNQNSENPDTRTAVERAVIQIVKDNIPDDLVTEQHMEEYCEDFLDSDQVEQAVFDALRNNSLETTDIIHDNLETRHIRNMLTDNDIVEDILFDSVMQDDRFYSALVDNLVHAITNSETLDFNQRIKDIVFEDVLDTECFFNMFMENLKVAVERSDVFHKGLDKSVVNAIAHNNMVDFKKRVREVVTEDHTLKDELRTIVKAHFADTGEFAARVCQIIRNKL